MTTPGPKATRWRVRRSTGTAPTVDLTIPPFNRKRVSPIRWLADQIDSTSERPKEIVTTSMRDHEIRHEALEFRPWRDHTPKIEVTEEHEMTEMHTQTHEEIISYSDNSSQTEEAETSLSEENDTTFTEEKKEKEKPHRFRVFLKDLLLYSPILYQIISLLPVDTVVSIDRVMNTLVIGGGLHFMVGGFDRSSIEKYLFILGTSGLLKIRTHPVLYS